MRLKKKNNIRIALPVSATLNGEPWTVKEKISGNVYKHSKRTGIMIIIQCNMLHIIPYNTNI